MFAFKQLKDTLRKQFISGVLAVVPLILTYAVLKFLFEALEGLLAPIVYHALGYKIPGLGIISTLLIILLTGVFMRSLIGASIYKRADRFLAKAPLIRIFYLAAKQLIEAISMPGVKAFREVVLIEYMRRDLYAIGFATKRVRYIETGGQTKKLVGVFIPSTPTPISGVVVFVPENEAYPLNLTVEEALKMMVSGGIVAPDEIKNKTLDNYVALEEENAAR